MYSHWTELRSYGQERLQQRIAEADEWRMARRAAPAHGPRPVVWQMLTATLRRFATLRLQPAQRTEAQPGLALPRA